MHRVAASDGHLEKLTVACVCEQGEGPQGSRETSGRPPALVLQGHGGDQDEAGDEQGEKEGA